MSTESRRADSNAPAAAVAAGAPLYGPAQRTLQQAFETVPLADRLIEAIVAPTLDPAHRAFIESRDFFFLSTVDHRGYPTCSHKGGPPGFVRVLDERTLAFPSYDGNGMYLSMGNIAGQAKVGLLFIDFETPHRVRVHGVATVDPADPLLATFPGAELVVRVALTEAFVNCPRYIHPHRRVGSSRYVPGPDGSAPQPQWKRIDAMQDVLAPRDAAERTASEEPAITIDEYMEKVARGEG
jgi:predicted pyridoxine 5'-phosphate oxidase superfamily flavin-nucleotide-binding protein